MFLNATNVSFRLRPNLPPRFTVPVAAIPVDPTAAIVTVTGFVNTPPDQLEGVVVYNPPFVITTDVTA